MELGASVAQEMCALIQLKAHHSSCTPPIGLILISFDASIDPAPKDVLRLSGDAAVAKRCYQLHQLHTCPDGFPTRFPRAHDKI
eukprot:1157761-Pelagomonas_calceolata.AAC.1